MTIVESGQNFISNSLAVETTANQSSLIDFTELVTDGTSIFEQTFNELLSSTQVLDTENNESSNTADSKLLSSLGLNFLSNNVTESIGQLPSESFINSMQSALLSTLQLSVFNIKPSSDDAVEVVSDIQPTIEGDFNNLEQTATEELSILTSINQYSFGDNGLDLDDGFDTLNILQHIPVLSSVYQENSGQEINAIAKLSGAYLYGGVAGLAFSVLDLAFEGYSGNNIGDTLLNFNYSELFFTDGTQSPDNEGSYFNKYRDEIVYQNKTIAK